MINWGEQILREEEKKTLEKEIKAEASELLELRFYAKQRRDDQAVAFWNDELAELIHKAEANGVKLW